MRTAAPALCAHGLEAALCRDEMAPEVVEAVDFVHRHAYVYAEALIGTSDVPDRDAAEDFAAHVARDTARREGDLSGDLRSDLAEWISAKEVTSA